MVLPSPLSPLLSVVDYKAAAGLQVWTPDVSGAPPPRTWLHLAQSCPTHRPVRLLSKLLLLPERCLRGLLSLPQASEFTSAGLDCVSHQRGVKHTHRHKDAYTHTHRHTQTHVYRYMHVHRHTHHTHKHTSHTHTHV